MPERIRPTAAEIAAAGPLIQHLVDTGQRHGRIIIVRERQN